MKLRAKACCAILGTLCALAIGSAHAAKGVDPKDIVYETWPNGRPQSMTVTSGYIDVSIQFWGPPLGTGVVWFDANKQKQWKPLNKLCQLNVGSKLQCGETAHPHPFMIEEVYIGQPSGLRLAGGQKTKRFAPLSATDLEGIPPNAQKVLLLNVWNLGLLRQSLTVVYDEGVTDDELRMIALEDGVYRIYRFRED